MDFTIFQERLKQLIDSQGKNLHDLAYGLNMSPPTLSRYLTGTRKPDIDYIIKIAEYFHVSIDWLVGASGEIFRILPPEIQEVAELYSIATQDDKRVIQAVISKYKTKAKSESTEKENTYEELSKQ